jgi:serine/threonine-protein phosphatase CPPED1
VTKRDEYTPEECAIFLGNTVWLSARGPRTTVRKQTQPTPHLKTLRLDFPKTVQCCITAGRSTNPATTMTSHQKVLRFGPSQVNNSLVHGSLPQPSNPSASSPNNPGSTFPPNGPPTTHNHSQVLDPVHTFVVTADTQFGMMDRNRPRNGDWNKLSEVEYSLAAIRQINCLQPRPLFCCVCGDLVEMTANIYKGKAKTEDDSAAVWTEQECDSTQDAQNDVFKETWSRLHPDIALVCVCGNHDVGNQPTAATVQRFRTVFGDDSLAFWANGTYNIVLNTSLISNPIGAPDLDEAQWTWLQDRLIYAQEQDARNIFVFGHHPWFLYNDDEDETALQGILPWPSENCWGPEPANFKGFPESYFPIPRERRRRFLDLFERYRVSACFAGHFHQNLVAKTTFGMDMIVTGPLSVVLQSTDNNNSEPSTRGFRLVSVHADAHGGRGTFSHEYVSLE